MGNERRGKHRYYYRSTRVDGRVVKVYVGKGRAAKREMRLAEQIKAMSSSGFEWGEYLGVSAPWENLKPPPPRPR